MAAPRSRALVDVVGAYLSEIDSQHPDFFKSFVDKPQAGGRLFFDFSVGESRVSAQAELDASLADSMNKDFESMKSKSLTHVRAMSPVLDLDNINEIKDFATANFSPIKNSDAWKAIVAKLSSQDATKLERMVAGALTYKVMSVATNPHLADIHVRGSVKLFTAVVNMSESPHDILKIRRAEYIANAITDPIQSSQKDIIRYITEGSEQKLVDTLAGINSTLTKFADKLEYKYIGSEAPKYAADEIRKGISELYHMDSKSPLSASQGLLRDKAITVLEQLAQQHNLVLTSSNLHTPTDSPRAVSAASPSTRRTSIRSQTFSHPNSIVIRKKSSGSGSDFSAAAASADALKSSTSTSDDVIRAEERSKQVSDDNGSTRLRGSMPQLTRSIGLRKVTGESNVSSAAAAASADALKSSTSTSDDVIRAEERSKQVSDDNVSTRLRGSMPQLTRSIGLRKVTGESNVSSAAAAAAPPTPPKSPRR